MSELFISYAQHGEDVILWRAFKDRAPGTYVDVGAFDPEVDSVTLALYQRGWRGVHVEAQADRAAILEKARPDERVVWAAAGDHDGETVLTVGDNPGWATTLTIADEAVAGMPHRAVIPLRTLATLLPELGITSLDVLKIDVEGAEPAVVRGLLDGQVRPLVCVVEGVSPEGGRGPGDEAVALLVAAGYVHCMFDGLNHYLTTDLALVEALSVPASPVDHYMTDFLWRTQDERVRLLEMVANLSAENARLSRLSGAGRPRPEGLTAADLTAADHGQPDVQLSSADEADGVDAAPTTSAAHGGSDLPPAERHARRRRVVARLLALGRAGGPGASNGDELDLVAALTEGGLPPEQVIRSLYLAILGRQADDEGLSVWTDSLRSGGSALATAWAFASSDEGLHRAPADREAVVQQLRAIEAVTALSRLGVGWGDQRYVAGLPLDAQILVCAVFEAAFARQPTAAELHREVGKLRAGLAPDRLIRACAGRLSLPAGQSPIVRARRLVTRLVRRLGWGRVVSDVRVRVTLIQAREVARLASEVDRLASFAMLVPRTTDEG